MGEQHCLKLKSGFVFDYTNLVGEGRITEEDINGLSGKIQAACQAISHMRQTGEVRAHLSKDGLPEKVLFSQLPYIKEGNLNNPQSITCLEEFGQSLRYQVDAVVSFGIGGSYLGNKVLFDVHCGEFWNSGSVGDRNGYPKVYFSGNNIDPRRTGELTSQLIKDAETKAIMQRDRHVVSFRDDNRVVTASAARQSPDAGPESSQTGKPYKVLLVVISKSGSTLDTMSNFMVVYDRLQKASSVEVSVVAVTDPAQGERATLLGKLADEKGWPRFSVPDGIGGRFSIFSEVGLVTAACIGFDIEAFLSGARDMDLACQDDTVENNPALLNAVLKYLAAEQYGRDIEVFMPYGDYLKSTSEWYVQMLAESLGKRVDRDGREVFYGRTPIVAVGTTDMHAQTQQHQDGKRNKVVQFVQVASWQDDPVIPNVFPEVSKLAEISSIPLSKALDAAREANAEALIKDARFNAVFVMPQMNAYHLGELLYMLALSVAYEGELADVDAFDQPGVEAYKKILGTKLKKG